MKTTNCYSSCNSLGKLANVIVYWRAAKNAKLVVEHVAKMVPRDASPAGFDSAHPPCETALWDLPLYLTFALQEDASRVERNGEEPFVKAKRPNHVLKSRRVGNRSERRVY